MSIYLDYIFIENFCITFIILLETAYLIRKRTNKLRLVLGSIICALYVCIMIVLKIDELDYVISKIALNIITVYIAFKTRDIKEYLKIISVFYLVTGVNIGTNIFISQMFNLPVNSLRGKTIVYGGGVLASYLIFKYLWKIYNNNMTEKDCLYNVIIKFQNKSFKYTGFLDTGNSLKDIINNRYVLFAKNKENIEEYIDKRNVVDIDVITVGKKEKKRRCFN